MSEENVLVAVIGGSGLYQLDNLTPWGFPSSPITIAALPSGTKVAFLAVTAAANIAALKSIGVSAIISFSAVGSLREEISPGSFAMPSQIIDRTKGVRQSSFFDGTSIVAHAMFGDPFSNKLVKWLEPRVRKARGRARQKLFTDKTIVCMEGPQFSTRAESMMYRQWGGDLINMSALPEAKLAREANFRIYALIAMATDYDSWRPAEGVVTAHDVMQTMHDNSAAAKLVVSSILEDLHSVVDKHHKSLSGAEKDAIIAEEEALLSERGDRKKLAFILPEHFTD
ncbi:S-methyl-5'-thioadenosine phosphorylase [Coprinopsis sp. MPI-PUGE-AT-0042]|nr:S-methyl-5'-thioadenosine phosphorylase [Coprinopsis sp. MPI-PUGE-AT-0042]